MEKYDWLGFTGLQKRQERWKTGRKQVPGNAHLKLFSICLKWEISMQWKSTPVRAPWIMGLHRHPACPGAGHPRGTLGLLWDASGFWTCSHGKTEEWRLIWEYEGASDKWFLSAYLGFLFPDPIRQFPVVVKIRWFVSSSFTTESTLLWEIMRSATPFLTFLHPLVLLIKGVAAPST